MGASCSSSCSSSTTIPWCRGSTWQDDVELSCSFLPQLLLRFCFCCLVGFDAIISFRLTSDRRRYFSKTGHEPHCPSKKESVVALSLSRTGIGNTSYLVGSGTPLLPAFLSFFVPRRRGGGVERGRRGAVRGRGGIIATRRTVRGTRTRRRRHAAQHERGRIATTSSSAKCYYHQATAERGATGRAESSCGRPTIKQRSSSPSIMVVALRTRRGAKRVINYRDVEDPPDLVALVDDNDDEDLGRMSSSRPPEAEEENGDTDGDRGDRDSDSPSAGDEGTSRRPRKKRRRAVRRKKDRGEKENGVPLPPVEALPPEVWRDVFLYLDRCESRRLRFSLILDPLLTCGRSGFPFLFSCNE